MKIILLILSIAFSLISFCAPSGTRFSSTSTDSIAAVTPTPNPVVSVDPSPLSSIRTFDFQNFTYPWTKDLADNQKLFTLTDGELPETRTPEGKVDKMGVYWSGIKYGDVTGDAREEAIISMSILTGGSSIPHMIYIYGVENNRPLLLWHFSTSDRANGGFKDAYADAGQLILELNSPVDSKGDCCPTQFKRTRYKWSGKQFQKTQEELSPVS